MTKKNILAGWNKTRLFPFNPNRVLRDVTKPVTEQIAALPIRTAELCHQEEIVQSPVTPVSSEGLTSLLNLINLITQNPHETSRQHRSVQKLGNAAQTSFARHALDQDHIQLLYKANNEAQVRRKTKSNSLGDARVMTFTDLKAVRAKRAEKDAAKEAKGKCKRSRKPKSAASEAEEATTDKMKRGKKRKSVVAELAKVA